VAGPQGELLAQAASERPEVVLATIERRRTEDVRRIWPFLRDRRIDAYADLVKRYGK
jgi:N-carbamoylputrescine amidase